MPRLSNIVKTRKFRTLNSRFEISAPKSKRFLGSRLPWASDPKTSHAPNILECFIYLEQLGFQEASQNFKTWRQDFIAKSDSDFHAGNSVHTKDETLGIQLIMNGQNYVFWPLCFFLEILELWIHLVQKLEQIAWFFGGVVLETIFVFLVAVLKVIKTEHFRTGAMWKFRCTNAVSFVKRDGSVLLYPKVTLWQYVSHNQRELPEFQTHSCWGGRTNLCKLFWHSGSVLLWWLSHHSMIGGMISDRYR